ncbi:hypothetical protein [Phyllobacterium myrsinacearum]|uniref:Uncharacterized protein n=1 Tax=Phyllobacterium myrsinacearum TaxID=28101 RepID=A0A839EWY8_9HYPH|nr:hypothetical protein [Phyllobacterium myrsinacearum]MBA8881816.1 hypothetical protein [Phyllobacterium myrsinacearum]
MSKSDLHRTSKASGTTVKRQRSIQAATDRSEQNKQSGRSKKLPQTGARA